MPRRIPLGILVLAGFSATVTGGSEQSPAANLSPTRISLKQTDSTLGQVAAALSKEAGIEIVADSDIAKIKCPVSFTGTPLWEALEKAARDSDARLLVADGDGGRKITLARRGASKEVSAVSGAFRISVRSVTGRLLFDTGATFHELQLLVHWEPRFHVFRIDSTPRIAAAKFDKSNDLITDPAVTRQYPTGASAEMRVRLAGLPRRAAKIDAIAGEIRATAAEKMLTFQFDNLASTAPVEKKIDRVTAGLKPLTFDETTRTWEVELELVYPPGGPVFESFEEHKWLRDNRLRLVSPEAKPFIPDSEDVVASGNKVSATYRFKGGNPKAKGWSLVYEAPGPLVEVMVPFKLENIPVP